MAEVALRTKPWNYNIEYICTARETYALNIASLCIVSPYCLP